MSSLFGTGVSSNYSTQATTHGTRPTDSYYALDGANDPSGSLDIVGTLTVGDPAVPNGEYLTLSSNDATSGIINFNVEGQGIRGRIQHYVDSILPEAIYFTGPTVNAMSIDCGDEHVTFFTDVQCNTNLTVQEVIKVVGFIEFADDAGIIYTDPGTGVLTMADASGVSIDNRAGQGLRVGSNGVVTVTSDLYVGGDVTATMDISAGGTVTCQSLVTTSAIAAPGFGTAAAAPVTCNTNATTTLFQFPTSGTVGKPVTYVFSIGFLNTGNPAISSAPVTAEVALHFVTPTNALVALQPVAAPSGMTFQVLQSSPDELQVAFDDSVVTQTAYISYTILGAGV